MTGSPRPVPLIRGAAVLIGFLALGCGRDAAPEDPAEQGAADTGQVTTEAGEEGLPISASIAADSAGVAAGGAAPVDSLSADARQAVRIVEDYYGAINVGDYERAFAYWGDAGRASGQTYLQFVSGFAETAGVEVSVGEPGRVEGAAGSRYIEIPVVVTATSRRGGSQRFEGTYTLRRSVVDGATPEQRRWHLHDAELREVR